MATAQAFDHAVQDEINKAIKSKEALKDALFHVKLAARAIMKHLPEDQGAVDEYGRQLEAKVKQLIEKDAYIDAWTKAIQELKNDRAIRQQLERAGEADQPLPNLDRAFKAKVEAQVKSTDINYAGHSFMKALKSVLKLADDADEDEDLQVLTTQADGDQALKCPITTTLLQEPVKSTVCQHVYSKHAIGELLRRNRQQPVQCPVVGCKSMVKRADLEPDQEKEQLVRRHLRQQQTATLTQHDEAEVIDD